MTNRWQWRALPMLIASALALAGCPAPTGRHRGEGDGGGGPGTCTSTPVANGYCASNGTFCTDYIFCPGYGTIYDSCGCYGNVWNCGSCPVGYDGGGYPPDYVQTGTCPASPVAEGDYCFDQTGLVCPGTFAADCHGSYSREYCECAPDGFYRCSFPGCVDAGVDGNQPLPDVFIPRDGVSTEGGSACPADPSAGMRCSVPGYGCWYGGDASSCRTYCNCDSSGAWVCINLPCADAAAD